MTAKQAWKDLWTRSEQLPAAQEEYLKTRLRVIAKAFIGSEVRPGRYLVSGGSLAHKYRFESQTEANDFAISSGASVVDEGVGA